MCDLVIAGARLDETEARWDVGIEGEKIAWLRPTRDPSHTGENCECESRERIEARGRFLLPGMIDAHVHTRDPGYTGKEDWRSATMAAANGGVTTMMAMPNCNPPMTNRTAIRLVKQSADAKALVHVALTGGTCAAAPGWIVPSVQAGAVAMDVYDDMFSCGTGDWLRLFREAKEMCVPLCFYLMDPQLESLRKKQSLDLGKDETDVIADATDGETEALSIARIFPMAAYFHVPVVLRMVSTKKALEMVRAMRNLYPDALVYVEICVHYLFLTRDALRIYGSGAHIHPPLRTQQDVDELWHGVRDGTVDYIASDHAPHMVKEKNRERLASCASGMTGLETELALLLDARSRGLLSLEDIRRLCCENPANIYGLSSQRGRISPGYDADLILIDENERWTVNHQQLYTRGAPGPFEGRELKGKVCVTVCGGRVVMKDGRVIG
ncbi:MAG: dihydroorotase family protein [Clostridiales bacterium]|nr:dihydroorotase family protein [Clostridiales bacterium]